MINVKSVVLPKGGISYNPSQADHVKVLKDVAKVEEACVMQELKNLKKVHPLEYAERNDDEDSQNDDDKSDASSYGDEESSDGEEVDPGATLAVGKPVDRSDIKTTAQRNLKVMNKIKEQEK